MRGEPHHPVSATLPAVLWMPPRQQLQDARSRHHRAAPSPRPSETGLDTPSLPCGLLTHLTPCSTPRAGGQIKQPDPVDSAPVGGRTPLSTGSLKAGTKFSPRPPMGRVALTCGQLTYVDKARPSLVVLSQEKPACSTCKTEVTTLLRGQ